MFSQWISAFGAALGNSLVDMCKKKIVTKGLNTWEVMALINTYLMISNMGYCIITESLPASMEFSVILICCFKVLGKILAQYTYLKSLQMAPLSSVIPYLAWNPVFLLITGSILFNEKPSIQGVIGCLFVVSGAYFISMNAKQSKEKNQKDHDLTSNSNISHHKQKELDEINLSHRHANFGEEEHKGDEEEFKKLNIRQNSPIRSNKPENEVLSPPFSVMRALKDFWEFKAGLYMMVTTLCWTYTSTIEKYLFTKTSISSSLLLGIQSTLITAIVMTYCLYKDRKFLDQLYKAFFPLIGTSAAESFGTLSYFLALKGGLYVSYVTAVKRAGNIFLSMMIGNIVYKEKLTKYNWISAGCMIFGVCLIVLT